MNQYRGRFAPTPSGDLHLGSLIAALASFLEARSQKGEWLVRIDDVDELRAIPGAADRILQTLDDYGLHWDGSVVHQSQRTETYADALSTLQKKAHCYPCFCSRKSISREAKMGTDGFVYPGNCRTHLSALPSNQEKTAIRLLTQEALVVWQDQLCGMQRQDLEHDFGDFVIWRKDGFCAYHLATAVDDAEQKITDVVRGRDLLFSTPRQIFLQDCLGFSHSTYCHLPLVVNGEGKKLSKQTQAPALQAHDASRELVKVLQFLEQMPPPKLEHESVPVVLQWALENWDLKKVSSNRESAQIPS